MITIKEIAEKAGVSRRTVDRVLYNRGQVNPETRDKIEKIMKEYDFVPNEAARGLAARKKNFRLAFCTLKGSYNSIFNIILDGAKQKAKELEPFGVSVDYYVLGRETRMDPEDLKKFLDEFSCDGLAIVPGEFPEIEGLIQRAVELEIPVVYYNIDSTFADRMCYVGCDYQKAGRLAAGVTALSIENKGNVAVISQPAMSRYSYQERVIGFKEELQKYFPEVTIAKQIELDYREDEERVIRQLKESIPDLKAVYLVNPGNYSLCKAIRKEFSKGIRIITNDLVARDMLGDGTIDVTITQDPLTQGSMPLQVLFDYLAYGKRPAGDFYYTNLAINIRESIS